MVTFKGGVMETVLIQKYRNLRSQEAGLIRASNGKSNCLYRIRGYVDLDEGYETTVQADYDHLKTRLTDTRRKMTEIKTQLRRELWGQKMRKINELEGKISTAPQFERVMIHRELVNLYRELEAVDAETEQLLE